MADNKVPKESSQADASDVNANTQQAPSESSSVVLNNLDIVLQTARDEYSAVHSTWIGQNAKLHTYLWLSVAILGAESVLSLKMLELSPISNVTELVLITISFTACALGLIAGFVAFFSGVDALRGRGGVSRPLVGIKYSEKAIPEAIKKLNAGTNRIKTINILCTGITYQIGLVDTLSKTMRKLSVINLISASFGVVGFVLYCFIYIIKKFTIII